MLISNLGLAGIIRLSTPVLNAIYPVAIVLIALSFLPLAAKKRAVWPLAIAFTAAQSNCTAAEGRFSFYSRKSARRRL